MLLHYWEKRLLTPDSWRPEAAAMGITAKTAIEVIERTIAQEGEAVVSSYLFRTPSGDAGAIVVCHNLGRGAISFGENTRWGNWDEAFEILTLDGSGEKINFEGKPVYEGDEGSCSLGNF
ncbi:MAG: hypothetical protein C4567_08050 [Deltaproteobacteria bacterium]|nr:MAG: hypothetical protein C4567_08050 [Deltaproteobacteria bacterium]